MAWDDEYNFEVPDYWTAQQEDMFVSFAEGSNAALNDKEVQFLYEAAMLDISIPPYDRAAVMDGLADLMQTRYGIDFWEEFDWDEYREYYERQRG